MLGLECQLTYQTVKESQIPTIYFHDEIDNLEELIKHANTFANLYNVENEEILPYWIEEYVVKIQNFLLQENEHKIAFLGKYAFMEILRPVHKIIQDFYINKIQTIQANNYLNSIFEVLYLHLPYDLDICNVDLTIGAIQYLENILLAVRIYRDLLDKEILSESTLELNLDNLILLSKSNKKNSTIYLNNGIGGAYVLKFVHVNRTLVNIASEAFYQIYAKNIGIRTPKVLGINLSSNLIVMEYIPTAITIEEYITDILSKRSIGEILEWMIAFFEQYSNIIKKLRLAGFHYDIKLGNLLICKETNQLIMIDFGMRLHPDLQSFRGTDTYKPNYPSSRAYVTPRIFLEEHELAPLEDRELAFLLARSFEIIVSKVDLFEKLKDRTSIKYCTLIILLKNLFDRAKGYERLDQSFLNINLDDKNYGNSRADITVDEFVLSLKMILSYLQ